MLYCRNTIKDIGLQYIAVRMSVRWGGKSRAGDWMVTESAHLASNNMAILSSELKLGKQILHTVMRGILNICTNHVVVGSKERRVKTTPRASLVDDDSCTAVSVLSMG